MEFIYIDRKHQYEMLVMVENSIFGTLRPLKHPEHLGNSIIGHRLAPWVAS